MLLLQLQKHIIRLDYCREEEPRVRFFRLVVRDVNFRMIHSFVNFICRFFMSVKNYE